MRSILYLETSLKNQPYNTNQIHIYEGYHFRPNEHTVTVPKGSCEYII